MIPWLDDWSAPPRQIRIDAGQMHVWRFALDLPVTSLWELLSADETERAHRYHFRHDQDRFVAGRAILRQILASYLGLPPDQLCFSYSAQGRPALQASCLPAGQLSELDFNLAHSEDRALLAIGVALRVGIDLERIDPTRVDAGLFELVCSPSELDAARGLPDREQVTFFYRCWTRKEAYLKARGDGLILPMSSISVLDGNGQPLAAPGASDTPDLPGAWSLADLSSWPGFAASLAWASPQAPVSGDDRCLLSLWDWRPPA